MTRTRWTLLAAPLLAFAAAASLSLSTPAFAQSSRCGGTTQPVCSTTQSCLRWELCQGGPSGATKCCAQWKTDYYYFADETYEPDTGIE